MKEYFIINCITPQTRLYYMGSIGLKSSPPQHSFTPLMFQARMYDSYKSASDMIPIIAEEKTAYSIEKIFIKR